MVMNRPSSFQWSLLFIELGSEFIISISERFEASEASPSKKFSILFKGFDASENTLVLTAVYSASASIIHLLAQIVERSTH